MTEQRDFWVSDTRKALFARVDFPTVDDSRLDGPALNLYLAIVRHCKQIANREGCRESLSVLARSSRIKSLNTVRDRLRLLESLEYIVVSRTRGRKPWGIDVIDPPTVHPVNGSPHEPLESPNGSPHEPLESPNGSPHEPLEGHKIESEREREEKKSAASPPPPPTLQHPKDGEPKNQELKSLVADYYDTFMAVRGFKSSEGGGLVAGILGRIMRLRTEAVTRWELGAYWDWLEVNGVHGGDIRDFSKKENMMNDKYLDAHKKER